MDLFLVGGLAVAAVVLFAAFGLAVPARQRPLLMASGVLVGAIVVTQALISLFGATPARLALFGAAMVGMVLIGALIWHHNRHA